MTTIRRTRAGRAPAVLALLALTALVCALPGTADAKPNPPQLSIAVDDAHDVVGAGDTLGYRVTVTNLGARAVTDLQVTQTLPGVAKLVSADHGGTAAAGAVTWSVDLEAGAKATRQSSVAVAKTLPDDLLRLATVACARTTAKAPPTVCATDSDQLPAGAAAEQQRGLPDQPRAAIGAWWPVPGAIVLCGLLLAMVIAVLIVLRRHRQRPDDGAGESPGRPADLVSSGRR